MKKVSRQGKHSPDSSILGVVLKKTEKEYLRHLAEQSGMKLSAYIRNILIEAIERRTIFVLKKVNDKASIPAGNPAAVIDSEAYEAAVVKSKIQPSKSS